MKKIQEMNLSQLMTQATGPQTSSISQGDVDFINNLFKQLTAIKPAWKNAFENKDQIGETKKQWIKGFIESGISDPAMIERGLLEARRDPNDFMPSVGRFIEWCRPSEQWEHKGAAYVEYKRPALPDLNKQERNRKAGRAALDKLLNKEN